MKLHPPARFFLRMLPLFALIAGIYLMAGCGSGGDSDVPDTLAKKCVMVTGETPAFGWAAWTAKHMPETPRFSVDQLDEAIRLCQKTDAALILADEPFALESEREEAALASYLEAGGRLIRLGSSPSSAPFAYTFTTTVLRVKGTDTSLAIPATAVISPRPPALGSGGSKAAPGRWIPVVTATSPDGLIAGWPGWVQLEPRRSGAHAIIAALAMPPLAAEPEKTKTMLGALLAEATRQVYLLQYGLDRYTAPSRTSVQAGARILDRRRGARDPLKLVIRWVNPDGLELRRHVSPPVDADIKAWRQLDAGLAPEPPGKASELYRLDIEIRDRNDQTTLDSASQVIKILPESAPPVMKPVMANHGFLMQDRVPLFMLGVQYWPRTGSPVPEASARDHWLDPAWFSPEIVTGDLDLLASVGVNAIAIEYTDIAQAPQLLFVLDELRRRNMWASVYMPALYPLDLRMDTALRMLDAVRPAIRPELFALEIARGITIRSRADLRRLDASWANWLQEQYGSAAAAEKKLGVTLWRERGELAVPPEIVLSLNPAHERGLNLYYTFLHEYVSRQIGYARRALRSHGHELLLTARSAYSQPSDGSPVLNALDISAGILHLDFLLADAWNLNPLDHLDDDVPAMSAYLQAVGGGRPVIWSAFGQPLDTEASQESQLRQQDVLAHQLKSFIAQDAAGAFAWRFPSTPNGRQDWGMINPDGTWRPAGDALREARLQLRRWRPERPRTSAESTPWYLTASQWLEAKNTRSGIFSGQVAGGAPRLPGEGVDTFALMQKDHKQDWSISDGHRILNAEWGRLDGGAREKPGDPARAYAGRPLKLELINAGSVSWRQRGQRDVGSVWVRVTRPGHAEQWLPVEHAGRGDSQFISWTPSGPGPFTAQAYLFGYGSFGEQLRVDVTSPPGLF